MKNITLVSLTICLILVIVLVISAATLADIASETKTKAEQHFEKANELLKSMDYEAAIAEYKKVINLSSNSKIDQNAQYWIGQSHFRAGQFDAAQETFAKLIEAYPASAIVPVTKLMVERVEQAKENEEIRRAMSDAADKGFIIDPESGIKFTKIFSDEKLDVIEDGNWMTVSPDGRFLFTYIGNWVVPLEEGEPFKLIDLPTGEFPSWSPDGSKISFVSYEEDKGALWVIPVSLETRRANGPARKLVEGVRRLSTWSPDAKMIAYAANGDIWKIPVTGGTPQQITDSPMSEFHPAWSGDGSKIAFVRVRDEKKKLRDIWLISPKGGNASRIIENGSYPRWSSDGKCILFSREKNLWIFQLSSKREHKIELPGEWRAFDYFYSTKDGKLLFFDAGTSYRSALRVVSVYGGPSMDLSKNVDGEVWPYHQSWSPDGKWIITWGTKNETGSYIWMVSTYGAKPIPVRLEHVAAETPTLSPDGKRLAYLSGDGSLWVVPFSCNTGQPTGPALKIADDVDDRHTINWSPDGRKIAFITRKSGNTDIWVSSVNGDKDVQLTNKAEGEMGPQWSPDGDKIAYWVEEKGIWETPAAGGEPKQITKEGGTWSPDAKRIAFVAKPHISVIDVANGKVKNIVDTETLGAAGLFSISWSPDSKKLAFLSSWSAGYSKFDLWVVQAAGGSPMKLATDDAGGKYSLYWSPDGKRISYNSDSTVKLRTGAIWETDLEEFLKKASR